MALAYFIRSERAQFRQYFSKLFTVQVTGLDAGNLIDGAGETETITVTGVALGDMVLASSFGVSTVGVTCVASVTAADEVQIRVQNESGSTLNMAAQTVTLLIGRPDSVMFRANNVGI
jgi:hypothetical protein